MSSEDFQTRLPYDWPRGTADVCPTIISAAVLMGSQGSGLPVRARRIVIDSNRDASVSVEFFEEAAIP